MREAYRHRVVPCGWVSSSAAATSWRVMHRPQSTTLRCSFLGFEMSARPRWTRGSSVGSKKASSAAEEGRELLRRQRSSKLLEEAVVKLLASEPAGGDDALRKEYEKKLRRLEARASSPAR